MQSQGSTSSQPSFDSLSSSDSLLFSDSEQAEDDTDVFLTDSSSSVVIGRTGGAGIAREGGSQWTCDGFTDKEEESYKSESINKASHVGLDDREPTSQTPKSQGDLLFAQKCAELQGFVRPLLELLNGLKKGRFDRGLSSFQQSVAMDRIQRIVGVLQRPNSGEKYLNTLLQVEVMLKLWFPQIQTFPASAASSVAASPSHSLHNIAGFTPPHKHRDQLHIPVKKRRLSWTGTDSPTPSPVLLKSPRVSAEEEKSTKHGGSRPSSSEFDPNQNSTDMAAEEQGRASTYNAGCVSEPSLTWVHVAPILSPRKSNSSVAGNSENQSVTMGPLSKRDSPAMQDSSVSSTTATKNQKNVTKQARCQSQPGAGKQSDSKTRETNQGRRHHHHKSSLCPAHGLPP